jgi:hypothetical protein
MQMSENAAATRLRNVIKEVLIHQTVVVSRAHALEVSQ